MPDSRSLTCRMPELDILKFLRELVLIAPGFLLAITVHEFSHGYIAYKLGDPTAKIAGRLTFNPISHLDPFGTLALVLTRMIGWAKPVPVNSRYLKKPLQDMVWISLGGPAANLITAIGLVICLKIISVAALSGYRSPMTDFFLGPLFLIVSFGVRINIVLAVFNLIPVPPLDGFNVLKGLLPRVYAYKIEVIEPYGVLILLALLVTGVANFIIVPPIIALEDILFKLIR
ncbi:MAG: site-2 protease family protein [Desulfomonilaceae bacterium]